MKPRLGREEILAAAMRLADEAGTAALTMKNVAARLGPYTPMALYRHIPHKDGLVDLMLDAAAAEVPVPDHPGPHWRDDLETLAGQTRQMIKRHPWFAELVHSRPPTGPHLMRRVEFMLAVLVGRGATVAEAMTYAALVDRHIFGSGLQEAEEARMSRRLGLDDQRNRRSAFRDVHALAAADPDLPYLTSWLARPAEQGSDEQFAMGLAFLLDGVAARLPEPEGEAELTRRRHRASRR